MQQFMYLESTDGGMETAIISSQEELQSLHLYAWMRHDVIEDDTNLLNWMAEAEIGDYTEHRLGILVRLKDKE